MLVRFTTPVTLIGRTVSGQDALGNDVYSDAPATTAGIFAPGPSQEQINGQEQVTTQPTVFLPDIDVSAVDQVVILGQTFEVDGEPRNWPANAFTGWRPDYPLEVRLKRVTG